MKVERVGGTKRAQATDDSDWSPASLFNSLYAANGFTALYDHAADLLSLNHPLTEFETLFMQNTDPGLDLVEQVQLIPAPASIVLLGSVSGLSGSQAGG